MRDHEVEPLDEPEARLSARLQRWTQQAVVPFDPRETAHRAASASAGRALWRVRPSSPVWSRALILVLVGLLAVGVAFAVTGGAPIRRSVPPPPFGVVVTRPDGSGLRVVLIGVDGVERSLGRFTTASLGIDARYTLDAYGGISQLGWLELSASTDPASSIADAPRFGLEILIDLADPGRAPIILPANGFMRGRFAPDGRYALFCGSDCRAIQTANGATVSTSNGVWVLDPDRGTGSAVTVPDVQMFGGNPAFMWVADSSGFLAQEGSTWGVTQVDGGSFVPGETGLTTRWLQPSIPGLEDPTAETQRAYGTGFVVDPWYTDELEPAVPVHAALSFDGSSIWHLFDEPGASRAVLAQLTGPGVVDSVRSFVLPAGPALGFWLSPDDTHVVLYYGSFESAESVLAPVGQADGSTTTGSVIEGNVMDWVPAAAEAWPGAGEPRSP